MRVLIVNVHFAPESFGGATIVAEQTAAAMAADGHEVFVCTGTSDPGVPAGTLYRYEASGIPVVAIGRPVARNKQAEYDQPDLMPTFARVLEVVRPDIVHFHALQGLGVGLLEQAQRAGIPTAVTLHDAWWLCERQFMVRSTGQWCGQKAISPLVCATCVPDPAEHERRQQRSLQLLNATDAVLTPSRFWLEVMAGSGIDRERMRVNANGVLHPPAGWARQPRSGPVRFAYVGGNHPEKGALVLRRALSGLQRSDYTLRLVDAGMNLGHRSMAPDQWRHAGTTELVPGYTADGLDDFFADVDVLLFPSQCQESYGLTVREAKLRRVWVIATDGGGTAEGLSPGVDSTIIALDARHEGLQEAMRAAIDRPADHVPPPPDQLVLPTFADQARQLEQIYREATAGRDTAG